MKALLIESSPFFQKLIEKQLRSFGLDVSIRDSGIKALEMLAGNYAPDIICISLVTKDLAGPVIARQIRNLLPGKLPTIILLTSATDTATVEEARAAGMDEVFFKSDMARFRLYLAETFPPDPRGVAVRPRILYVEDSLVIQKMVLRHLGDQDWDVVTCLTEQEGWDRFQNEGFDLVMSDLHLGDGLSGLDLLRKVRSTPNKNIPFLIVSGVEEKDQRAALYQEGASDMVLKPVVREELLARVKVWLEMNRLADRVAELEAEISRT